MNSPFTTRPLLPDDLPTVAAVHTAAFPDSALTALGVETVRRYYAWQLSGVHEVLALGIDFSNANDRKRLIGYCFGGVFRGSLSGFINTNRAFLARRVLMRPHLLTNRIFRERFALGLRALRSALSVRAQHAAPLPVHTALPLPNQNSTRDITPPRSFGILSVAIAPDYQRMGAGALLMADAETFARQAGFDAIHLTVHPSNQRAVRFYERLGWQQHMEGNVWRGRMHKALME